MYTYSGGVSLYDELDINTNTNTHENKPNTQSEPTMTTTSTAYQSQSTTTNNKIETTSNIIKPTIPHQSQQQVIQPTIITHQTHPSHMYPPAEDHVDPSLTGVPLQHLASYKSHVLYVGGLSWWVTDADIRRTFDQFGTIIDVCCVPVLTVQG